MTVSRLLKSCAMLPASWPTISIFCACRTRSSISLAAVMSVMVPIRPVDSPDAS
jgi:hypothetical protein